MFDPLPRAAVEAFTGRDTPIPRYVIHLPATSADLAGAVELAYGLARSLDFLPEIDAGETTVSEEDAEHVHHRVCCDRLLPGRRRCALRARHDGPCDTEPPGPGDQSR
ncbi:hypothetical protein [Plantactinospora alkalitolerans]|uniref:hypothetical protein n=1 Tax=Plantactinospora alkalitolerans TaxID=2789879 RepID=UPI002B1FF40E|nr:hypothetical protein [Plantactinospora alkalitolerans]